MATACKDETIGPMVAAWSRHQFPEKYGTENVALIKY